jgi:hypothetical protein
MGRPGNAARMAKMRARRAPFTDAREGRLKKRIRRTFWLYGGKPLTTTDLMRQCYFALPALGKKYKSWHRTNVTRVAGLLAIRIGPATSQGRPIIWSPRPELMQDRRWVGLKHGVATAKTTAASQLIRLKRD